MSACQQPEQRTHMSCDVYQIRPLSRLRCYPLLADLELQGPAVCMHMRGVSVDVKCSRLAHAKDVMLATMQPRWQPGQYYGRITKVCLLPPSCGIEVVNLFVCCVCGRQSLACNSQYVGD